MYGIPIDPESYPSSARTNGMRMEDECQTRIDITRTHTHNQHTKCEFQRLIWPTHPAIPAHPRPCVPWVRHLTLVPSLCRRLIIIVWPPFAVVDRFPTLGLWRWRISGASSRPRPTVCQWANGMCLCAARFFFSRPIRPTCSLNRSQRQSVRGHIIDYFEMVLPPSRHKSLFNV